MNWTFNCFKILILKSLESNIYEILGKGELNLYEIRNLMRTLKYNFSRILWSDQNSNIVIISEFLLKI